MASHDQKFKAGETKGPTEEKTGQGMDTMKTRAQETNDKASQTAQSAAGGAQESKDRTGSYLSEKAGATKDKTSGTAQAAKDKASETAQATKDKAGQMAGSGHDTMEAGKERTGGFLQQSGEQIKGMAQGAADAVKHTFGMADTGEDDPNVTTTTKRDY